MEKSKNALSDEELEQVTGGVEKTADIDNTNISYDIQTRYGAIKQGAKIIKVIIKKKEFTAIDNLVDENDYILPLPQK